MKKDNFFPNQYLKLICFLLDEIYDIIAQQSRSDNNTENLIKNSYESHPYMVPPSCRLFALCIVVLVIICLCWDNTLHFSNEIFVNKVDKTSSETKMKDSDNIFLSGHWVSHYFHYEQWHGPHTFSLSFDHQKLKVTGRGIDDVGTFSIDGIYSLNTRRIGLTKKYQEGTGNLLENLGHTVIIQLEWNFEKRQFDGKWYVRTKKYHGEDRFELKFDRPTIVVDELKNIENC